MFCRPFQLRSVGVSEVFLFAHIQLNCISLCHLCLTGLSAHRIIATLSPRLFHLVPAGIRVIGGHCFCKPCCVGAKILFVDSPRLVDNESHYTRGAVLRWVGDEAKSSSHLSVDDIVLGSFRCMRTLAREDRGARITALGLA